MCFRKTWIDESKGDMSLAVFNHILQDIPDSVTTIFFGGMGEPLVHTEIVAMVKKAASLGKNVELLSNGMLLSHKMSEALLHAGLSKLWISIDSLNSLEYAKIRQNSNLELVTKNISMFNQARKELRSNAELALAFVVMRNNVAQLGQIPLFAARYGVSEVNISNAVPTSRESLQNILYQRVLDWNLGVESNQVALPKINIPMMNWRDSVVLAGLRDILSASLCEVSIAGQPIKRKRRYCRFVAEGQTLIKFDGHVSPCMALLHTAKTYWEDKERIVHHHSFGNVAEQGLGTIWNSEAYKSFRERVRSFEFSPCFQCSHCEDWQENKIDCFGNQKPTCGACLWAEGVITCP